MPILNRVNIVVVSPPGYRFSESFREIAETLLYALTDIGYATTNTPGFDPAATNIILGAHLLDEVTAQALPADSIIYNFEQVHGGSKWIKPVYVDLVQRLSCWDYSARNIAMWNRYCPAASVVHVPLGYVPQLSRITPVIEADIDVLFYGVINDRRSRVISKLHEAGLNVHAISGIFGAERDALIARAKVVLNVHFFDTKIFELSRVSYLLANRKAVVAEIAPDTEIDDELRGAVAGVAYDALVDKCIELVFDPVLARRIADTGFEIFSRRNEGRILAEAVTTPGTRSSPLEVDLPRRINVGSGKGWNLEALNVDIEPLWRPDLAADLNQPMLRDEVVDLGRFGVRKLPVGYFHEIHASHVLEHLTDLVTAMETFLRLLSEGSILSIEVPYDLSYGAWQDPTHVRALNERSWLYYTEWFWYLGWDEHRFQMEELQYLMSDYGQSLVAAGTRAEDVVRVPRAVDAMRVKLRKIALTTEEKLRGVQRWQE